MSGPAAAITTDGDLLVYGGLFALMLLGLLSAFVQRWFDPTRSLPE